MIELGTGRSKKGAKAVYLLAVIRSTQTRRSNDIFEIERSSELVSLIKGGDRVQPGQIVQ